MKNYRVRIEIKAGKFAYVQTEACRIRAREITKGLKRRWRPPAYCAHFSCGGHVAALNKHTHNLFFARLDIENFFQSISKNKLIRSLKKIGFSFAEAESISSISTVSVNGTIFLPYGFIQSPLLATIVLTRGPIGKSIGECIKSGVCVTLYVDDILISGATRELVETAFNAIRSAIVVAGFRENPQKTLQPSQRTEAFNIEVSSESLVVTPARMERFRERILARGESIQTIRYVKRVNDGQAEELERLTLQPRLSH